MLTPITFSFHFQWGGMFKRVGPIWIPDGLHLWINGHGVHIFLLPGHGKRVTFDNLDRP